MTKEDFCSKVGINTAEYDNIMLIAGQPTEVRSLVEQGLISPTTLKLAKATADRNEWTQKQFEDFVQESVKLAEQLGKRKVSGAFMQAVIQQHKPEELTAVLPKKEKIKEEKESTTELTSLENSVPESPPKPPKLKIKPTAKEIEQLFYSIMFCYEETSVTENGEVLVYFPEELAQKMEDYWNRIPEKIVEKLRDSK